MHYYLRMSSCCRAAPCEELFTWRVAKRNLENYRRRGLGRVERNMLASVPADQVRGKRVLEIGGGIGALQAELLLQGAEAGEVVELVGAYEPYAAQLARDVGVAERTRFRVTDVLQDPSDVELADVVLLDKVICCSPEGLQLLAVAAGLTRGVLVLSYPRYTWLLRAAAWLEHRLVRLMRRQYRFFVRPTEAIEAAAVQAGLTRISSGRGLVWEYATFGRTGTQ